MDIEMKSAGRSEPMKRVWATQRAAVEMVACWSENPVCVCGCGGQLEKRSGSTQTMFRNGHDAKLKAKALNVIRGKADAGTILEIAKALRNRLGFLKARPELIPAFKCAAWKHGVGARRHH